MIVTSFYKYVNLQNPKAFQKTHQAYCNKLAIKGKILVADEGINGSVSGTKAQIAKYKKAILHNKLFKGIMIKDTPSIEHPFKRMIVRVRPEIVTLGKKVNLKNTAKHISPKTLKKWIEKENIVLIDARNDYESDYYYPRESIKYEFLINFWPYVIDEIGKGTNLISQLDSVSEKSPPFGLMSYEENINDFYKQNFCLS